MKRKKLWETRINIHIHELNIPLYWEWKRTSFVAGSLCSTSLMIERWFLSSIWLRGRREDGGEKGKLCQNKCNNENIQQKISNSRFYVLFPKLLHKLPTNFCRKTHSQHRNGLSKEGTSPVKGLHRKRAHGNERRETVPNVCSGNQEVAPSKALPINKRTCVP